MNEKVEVVKGQTDLFDLMNYYPYQQKKDEENSLKKEIQTAETEQNDEKLNI